MNMIIVELLVNKTPVMRFLEFKTNRYILKNVLINYDCTIN